MLAITLAQAALLVDKDLQKTVDRMCPIFGELLIASAQSKQKVYADLAGRIDDWITNSTDQ